MINKQPQIGMDFPHDLPRQADGSGNNVWEPGVFGWTQI